MATATFHRIGMIGPFGWPILARFIGAGCNLSARSLSRNADMLHTFSHERVRHNHFEAVWCRKNSQFWNKSIESLCCNTQGDDGGRFYDEFGVLNFYILREIVTPLIEVEHHRHFLKERDIRSRVYISEQGINAQLSGPLADLKAYGKWVQSDNRFKDVHLQFSPSPSGHVFPRFKVRYKPSLVQVAGGTADLPLMENSQRAVALPPKLWREKLDKASLADQSNSSEPLQRSGRVLLLDVRNGYEWDVGHFQGAKRPEVDNFRDTRFGVSCSQVDPLAGVDPEETEVLMYCTGGIRCDVYSTILRKQGFQKLYSLQGGVANYLKEEGSEHWAGKLFVFDARLAVLPADYNKEGNAVEDSKKGLEEAVVARCASCAGSVPSVAHRNCANLDCNKLFLVCLDCAKAMSGCCCSGCQDSPRMRPFVEEPKPYARWHNYRPSLRQVRPPGTLSGRTARRQIRRQKMSEVNQSSNTG